MSTGQEAQNLTGLPDDTIRAWRDKAHKAARPGSLPGQSVSAVRILALCDEIERRDRAHRETREALTELRDAAREYRACISADNLIAAVTTDDMEPFREPAKRLHAALERSELPTQEAQ